MVNRKQGTQKRVGQRSPAASDSRQSRVGTLQGDSSMDAPSVFKSMVVAQRTLEFLCPDAVTVLMSVDADLRREVALFLVLRFNAWITRTANSTASPVATEVVRASHCGTSFAFRTPAAVPMIEPHAPWMTTAARVLLARGVTPHRESPTEAIEGPFWLTALRDASLDRAVCVPVQHDDVIFKWIFEVVLDLDVVDAHCCTEYRCTGMAPLKFVRCDEQAFYSALEREHRECMTVQATYLSEMGPVDLERAPHATRVWVPSSINCEVASLQSLQRLVSIDLSSCTTLQAVGPHVAESCPSLTSVMLPISVTTIDLNFASNSSVKSLDLSSCTALHSVGDGFAENCGFLSSILLPVSVTTVGSSFARGTFVRSLDLSVCTALSYIGNSFAAESLRLTHVALPKSVTKIGTQFAACTAVESLDLSSCTALCSVDAEFGLRCGSLTSILLPASVTTLDRFARNTALDTLDLSSCTALSAIKEYFVAYCPYLTSISLPDSVTAIGHNFARSTAVKTLDFSACIALCTIGNCFAEGCAQLFSVKLPVSVTAIGNDFCSGAVSLTTVDLSVCIALTTVGDGFGVRCRPTTVVTLPAGLTTNLGDPRIQKPQWGTGGSAQRFAAGRAPATLPASTPVAPSARGAKRPEQRSGR